jgi:hypothetical protein
MSSTPPPKHTHTHTHIHTSTSIYRVGGLYLITQAWCMLPCHTLLNSPTPPYTTDQPPPPPLAHAQDFTGSCPPHPHPQHRCSPGAQDSPALAHNPGKRWTPKGPRQSGPPTTGCCWTWHCQQGRQESLAQWLPPHQACLGHPQGCCGPCAGTLLLLLLLLRLTC